MKAIALAVGMAVAWGAPTVDPQTTAEAAASQVRLWLDLGELGKAEALTRRAVKRRPEDETWHHLRLRVLDAAGMTPWIEASYALRDPLDPAPALAYATWRVEEGRDLALDPGALGREADRRRALLALTRADPAAARAWLDAHAETEGAREIALRLALAEGKGDAAAAVLAAWPADAPLLPAVPALTVKGGPVATAADRLRGILDARADRATSPRLLLDAVEVALALGDADRLRALESRLAALRDGEPDLQEIMDGFLEAPTRWTAWEVPPRPRWSEARLRAEAERAVDEGRALPWGRPDEERYMARHAARALEAAGRPGRADKYREAYLGPCTDSRLAAGLVAHDRHREGRQRGEEDLLTCVGGDDLMPDHDPAGLDVVGELDRVADAWFRFGVVADVGRQFEDAALAYGIAAHLGPGPDRVALARQRAEAAGLAVASDGLPGVATLVARLGEVTWMRPAGALLASRAARARARTRAWLELTPESLAAAVTPAKLCVPTLRTRCQVERAVAEAAFRAAGEPVPDDLDRATDPGARRVGPQLHDRLRQVWFGRQAALARATKRTSTPDLARILASEDAVVVGRPAPRWQSAGVRSDDLKGRALVLAFWASWCRRCLRALPLLEARARAWAADDVPVRVLAVSVDDDPARYARAVVRVPLDGLTVFRDDRLRRIFRVDDLPTLVVVDPSGVLRQRTSGYDAGDLDAIDAAVRGWSSLSSTPGAR